MTDVPPGFERAVVVRFPLDGPEWCRAAKAAFLALPGVGAFRAVLWTVPLAMPLPLLLAWMLASGPIGGMFPAFVACEGPALVLLLSFEFWLRAHPRLSVYQMRRHVDDVVAEERWLSERGLFVRGNEETTLLPWSSIAWAKETPEFLLFRGPGATHFIPRRLLDDEELGRVRQLAAAGRVEARRIGAV